MRRKTDRQYVGKLVRSRAPLRISFGGGGTDVSPYMEEFGGAVLNATINKYAYASMRMVDREGYSVHSLDLDIHKHYGMEGPLPLDGELSLVKAVLNRFRETPLVPPGKGLEFYFHADAPPGSGLGTSSTLCAALLGLLRHWQQATFTDYELAEIAFAVEREDLMVEGGRQDQYASIFGGVNYIEFSEQAVLVNQLRVPEPVLHELQYLCFMCFTGKTRLSDNIIREQQAGAREKDEDRIQAMHEVKAIAAQMKTALLRGRLRELGELLDRGWEAKKRMASSITNPMLDEMYAVARSAGAIGGKVTGAGGGGHMLFICEFDKKHHVANALQRLGAQPMPFAFDSGGLQTWEVAMTSRDVTRTIPANE